MPLFSMGVVVWLFGATILFLRTVTFGDLSLTLLSALALGVSIPASYTPLCLCTCGVLIRCAIDDAFDPDRWP